MWSLKNKHAFLNPFKLSHWLKSRIIIIDVLLYLNAFYYSTAITAEYCEALEYGEMYVQNGS